VKPQPPQRTRKSGPPVLHGFDSHFDSPEGEIVAPLIGLLILGRKDSGTRKDFLGESSGPYFWGMKKHTPGFWGVQGGGQECPPYTSGLWSPAGPGSNLCFLARLKPCPSQNLSNANSVYFASGVGTEILRWESLASRAAPLPQDDRGFLGVRELERGGRRSVHGSRRK